MDWKPIDTAPKDGTLIIAFPCWMDETIEVVRWRHGKHPMGWVGTDLRPIGLNPTHWMPLPEPPKDTK